MPKNEKLTMTLPADIRAKFERMKHLSNIPAGPDADSELLRRALALYEMATENRADGDNLCVEKNTDTQAIFTRVDFE